MGRCIYHESLATDTAQYKCKVHPQQRIQLLNTEPERNNFGRNQSSYKEPLSAAATIRNGTFSETEFAGSVNGRAFEKVDEVFVGC
jgi:glutamine amidotransferase PdxT